MPGIYRPVLQSLQRTFGTRAGLTQTGKDPFTIQFNILWCECRVKHDRGKDVPHAAKILACRAKRNDAEVVRNFRADPASETRKLATDSHAWHLCSRFHRGREH